MNSMPTERSTARKSIKVDQDSHRKLAALAHHERRTIAAELEHLINEAAIKKQLLT